MPAPIALVTGATEGIGRAVAFALGREGYQVGVCARTAGRVTRLLQELEAAGIRAAGQAADVGNPDAVRSLVALVTTELGPVDLLVNNAGIAIFKTFAELTLEDWDATMATNLRSMYLVTREVLPGMRARRHGVIVNVASLAGKNPIEGGSAYVASKHAVLGFSRSLMLEVRKEGVRVLAICPGSVDTAMIREFRAATGGKGEILHADDVAQALVAALRMPERALVSELDIRPANP